MAEGTIRYKTLVDLSRILLLFEREAGERGVNEIARLLDLSPSKASRMLRTMEVEGIVERNSTTGKYRVGARLVNLGFHYLFTHPVRRIILPHLEEISRELGLYVSWGIFIRDRVIIVDRVTVNTSHTPHLIGSDIALHSSSYGKLFLAYLPEERQRELLQSIELERFTPRTLTTMPALKDELALTVARGYACDKEESRIGEEALSFPIFDESSMVSAALTVVYFTSHRPNQHAILPYLEAKTKFISRQLGYTKVFA